MAENGRDSRDKPRNDRLRQGRLPRGFQPLAMTGYDIDGNVYLKAVVI